MGAVAAGMDMATGLKLAAALKSSPLGIPACGALGAAAVSDAAGGAVAVVAGVVTDAVGEGGAGAAGVGVLAAGAAQEAREMMRSAATPLRGCLMPRFCQASGFAAWLSLGGCGVAQ